MRQTIKGWLVMGVLLGTIAYAIADDLSVTTYYPSPRGVYQELRATGNTYLATQSGNVGIGLTNPASKLVVAPGSLGPGAVGALFGGSVNAGNGFTAQVQLNAAAADTPSRLNFGDGPSATVTAQLESSHLGTGGGYLAFKTREQADVNLLERMRIDENGNVGIGTIGPTVRLDVNGGVMRVYTSDNASVSAFSTNADSRSYLSLVSKAGATQGEWRMTNDGPGGGALTVRNVALSNDSIVITSGGKVNIAPAGTIATAASLNVWGGSGGITPISAISVTTADAISATNGATAAGGRAIYAENRSPGGTGVYVDNIGNSGTGSVGVRAIGDTGVWGNSTAINGNAGYFDGNVKVATGYLQVTTHAAAGAPPGGDCNVASQAGRMIVQMTGTTKLWVCRGASGWAGAD